MLIRGPSGSGKSRLALQLIQSGRGRYPPFARLVGDDRIHLQPAGGRLVARAAETLGGLLEVCGVGIVQLPYEPAAVVGLVVDLGIDVERMPAAEDQETVVEGIRLPRLAVAAADPALPAVVALLTSSPHGFNRPGPQSIGR